MAYECISVETEDHICQITLDRPEAMNALNTALLAEVAKAVRAAEDDDHVRCIILTGGETVFAAGADITEIKDVSFSNALIDGFFQADLETIQRAKKPTIAAVAGFALGGGCELAMICDFIIAADNAKFGQPEINLGVIAGLGGTQRLTRFVGKSKSMEMHLTGRLMGAEEAERSGLVSRVVPVKSLLDEARAAAEKIAEKPALAVLLARQSVDRAYETTLSEGLVFEQRMFQALFATEDQKEGMSAFLEKREPRFRDR